jgi:hypothetical protein
MFLCEGTAHEAKIDAVTADREELYEKFSAFVVDKGSKDSKTTLCGLSEIQEGIAGLE